MLARTEKQWRSMVPHSKAGLEKFKRLMLPAWQHTLQLGSFAGSVPGEDRGTVVVFARAAERHGENQRLSEATILRRLERLNMPCITVDPIINSHDQFTNFFTTYNRTELQEQVRQLINACTAARDDHKSKRVVLVGSGRAGLPVLLAAPAADAVIADGDGVDVTNDEALLAQDLFCPGIRTIGSFEGAAMLAAPHPMLLHNISAGFPTDSLRSAYRAANAKDKLRVEPNALSHEEILKWISDLQPK